MATTAEADDYGGYDNELVGKVDDKFYCFVCQEIMRDPVLTRCCRQNYCHSCYQQWIRSDTQKSCPHCRQVNHEVQFNTSLQQEINTLKVNCPNCSVGCQWSTQLQQRKTPKHYLESDKNDCQYVKEIMKHRERCQYEPVHCSFQGLNCENTTMTCRKKMLRSELQHHQKVCSLRPFKCKFCSKESTYAAITGDKSNMIQKQPRIPPEQGHYAECPDYPLVCKNKCQSNTIKRSKMEAHLKECPRQLVPCPAKDVGCEVKMIRRDVNKHVEHYRVMERHLALYGRAHENAKAEIATQLDALNSRQAELNATKSELNRAKQEIQRKSQELNHTKQHLQRTTQELNHTREHLQRTKQELTQKTIETLNCTEELTKTNQELNRTKEKFQRTKQELRHTKEELDKTKQGGCRQS